MSRNTRSASVENAWRVPLWAWLPIGIAVGAEATVNALRAYGLGSHLEQFTVTAFDYNVSVAGAVLALAAVAVSFAQARAAWVAISPGASAAQRPIGILLSVLLLAVSGSAMTVTLLEAQRAKTTDEASQRGAFQRAQKKYADVAGQVAALKRFGSTGDALPRPREAVQAEIDALSIDWKIWIRSAKCTDISKEESKIECGRVLPLYEEQGAFASLIQLQPKLDEATVALDASRNPVLASTSEVTASDAWGWLMGAAVVLIATFGSVIFASPVDPDHQIRRTRPDGGSEHSDLKQAVLNHVQTELAAGRSVPSNVALVSLFGAKRSSVSDWLSDAERSGDIPARRIVGRCKVIQAGHAARTAIDDSATKTAKIDKTTI